MLGLTEYFDGMPKTLKEAGATKAEIQALQAKYGKGLFGGVKLFQILVSLIKNKLVAILMGPTGMGINGMILSTTA